MPHCSAPAASHTSGTPSASSGEVCKTNIGRSDRSTRRGGPVKGDDRKLGHFQRLRQRLYTFQQSAAFVGRWWYGPLKYFQGRLAGIESASLAVKRCTWSKNTGTEIWSRFSAYTSQEQDAVLKTDAAQRGKDGAALTGLRTLSRGGRRASLECYVEPCYHNYI